MPRISARIVIAPDANKTMAAILIAVTINFIGGIKGGVYSSPEFIIPRAVNKVLTKSKVASINKRGTPKIVHAIRMPIAWLEMSNSPVSASDTISKNSDMSKY